MATTNGTTTAATVILQRPQLQTIEIPLIGTSPLICHRWSEKAKKEMLDKQMKRAKQAKAAKDPDEDYRQSLYHHPDGGYGFPAVGFKAAAVRAGQYMDLTMTFLRGAFHVMGELVPIQGEPRPREDMVRLGGKVADIRYRAEFPDWSAVIPVRYNIRAISLEQLIALFETAGFSVGVGEWRPEKNGSYGTFTVGLD